MTDRSEQTLINWLILSCAPQLGPLTAAHLITHLQSVSNIISADYKTLRHLGLQHVTAQAILKPDKLLINKALQWHSAASHHIISCQCESYPHLLKQTIGSPLLLYVIGDHTLLSNHQIAIVGSRKPTPYGERLAFKFASELQEIGLTITSGLARGIDGAAHQGALAHGGPTIAVLGTGINRIYPACHLKLAHKIKEQGALISEFPLDSSPKAHHFPQRNRIISGLSLGTLVIEATVNSGSLITAHLAGDQGREVLAIPGSIGSPQSAGTNQLISQGAHLVTHVNHVIEALPLTTGCYNPMIEKTNQNKPLVVLDKDHLNLLKCVQFAVTSLDEICSNPSNNIAKLNSILLHLELTGYINKVPGGYIRVK